MKNKFFIMGWLALSLVGGQLYSGQETITAVEEPVDLAVFAQDEIFQVFFKGYEDGIKSSRSFSELPVKEQRFVVDMFIDFITNQPEKVVFLGKEVDGWQRQLQTGALVVQPVVVKQGTDALCGYHALYNAKTFLDTTNDQNAIDLLLPTEEAKAMMLSVVGDASHGGLWKAFVMRHDPQGEQHQGEWVEAEQLEGLITTFFPEAENRYSLIDGEGHLLSTKDVHYGIVGWPLFLRSVRRQSVDNWYFFFINSQTTEGQPAEHLRGHWVSLALKRDHQTGKRIYYVFNSLPCTLLNAPYVMNLINALEMVPPVAPKPIAPNLKKYAQQHIIPSFSPALLNDQPQGVVQKVTVAAKKQVAQSVVAAKPAATAVTSKQRGGKKPVVQRPVPIRPTMQPQPQQTVVRGGIARGRGRGHERVRQQAAVVAESRRQEESEQDLACAIELSLRDLRGLRQLQKEQEETDAAIARSLADSED